MSDCCQPPMIEFHNLTGESIGIRRDLIAVVIPNDPMGSKVATSYGHLEVMETPGEILALIRGVPAEPPAAVSEQAP